MGDMWYVIFLRGIECMLMNINTGYPIRLANGTNEKEGRIEIFWKDQWSSVCDNGWDDNDAVVVCKQLGYAGGTAIGGAFFGQGNGPVVFDNVNCYGNELNLFQCHRSDYGEHTCPHHQDAGVVCTTEGTYKKIVLLWT